MLFATLLIQVSKLTRPAGGGVVVVQLADQSPGAALRAAPRIADQVAKAGLRIDVSVMACDQPAKAGPSPASAGAKATPAPAPSATRPMAAAPSAALQNDPDRLIFRGRQIWDPTSAPPGSTHLPGYIFFSTSASEPLRTDRCKMPEKEPTNLRPPRPPACCSLLRVHAAHAARRPGLAALHGAAHGARAPHADAALPLQCDAEGEWGVAVCCRRRGGRGGGGRLGSVCMT